MHTTDRPPPIVAELLSALVRLVPHGELLGAMVSEEAFDEHGLRGSIDALYADPAGYWRGDLDLAGAAVEHLSHAGHAFKRPQSVPPQDWSTALLAVTLGLIAEVLDGWYGHTPTLFAAGELIAPRTDPAVAALYGRFAAWARAELAAQHGEPFFDHPPDGWLSG